MELQGKIVETIKLNNSEDGKVLFLLSSNHTDNSIPKQKDGNILCKAYPSLISNLAPVVVSGEFDGSIFDVESINLSFINQKITVDYILSVSKGKRLGKVLISNIVSKYKKDLFSMGAVQLEDTIKKDFPNIDSAKAKIIVDCLYHTHNKTLEKLDKLFAGTKADPKCITDIYSKYEEASIPKLKESPYNIGLEFAIPYTAIDKAAKEFHISATSYKRLEGLIHYALEYEAQNGHTWIYAKDLAKKVSMMSLKSPYMQTIYPIYISNACLLSKKLVLDEDKVSLRKYYNAERIIAQKLNMLKNFTSYIQVTKNDINEIAKELNFSFGKEQRESFRLLETGGVNILTGGPGTGKTSTIKGVVKFYLKKNPTAVVEFCAPTGRAAKRLAESTGYNAKTIHKLLEYQPFENGTSIKKTQADPIEADFIIVDECSMVNVELMAMLLEAIKPGTRLLLVGDENQLPCIGAGNILHDLIKSNKFPVYRLTENFRQKGNGVVIHNNSTRILAGETPLSADNFKIFRAKDEEDAYTGLCYFMKNLYSKEDPFKTQLIEPSRKGVAGTYKMNLFTHREIVYNSENDLSDSPMLNDKVIFTSTDYDVGYVNGDIGVIKALLDDEVVIWNDLEELVLPLSALRNVEFAYSYTIHKSQGSENENIIIYLPEEMSHMMTRSLLYTAVTRARETVTIIYTGNALKTCIANISDKIRRTRLQDFL